MSGISGLDDEQPASNSAGRGEARRVSMTEAQRVSE